MTIKQIYNLAIELGIKNDLRGQALVKRKLKRVKEAYDNLPEAKKAEFDQERLTNPFSDTRYFGNPDKKVKRVLAGIDMDVAEVLMAKELSKDQPIDLILAHHPTGPALAGLHEVMDLQVELLAKYGVPINIAESLTQIRMSEVARGISPVNHNRVIDAANLLGFEMMCVHTPSDNLVANFLDKYLQQNQAKIETVGDLLKLLKKIPEYQEAIKQKAGPRLFAGRESRYAGKVALTEITGGTEGSRDMYQHLAQAGIGTIVGMHMKEDSRQEAEKAHINIVIAGHMSSDSIGMNLFLDELVKKGIEVVTCSGLIRYSRIKKAASSKKK
ncbi:MAG: NGG1p interacting factor NIF3 [Candidatus Komeilibacteria bacterium CG10_big_fil_rev_8_21_14_0_10_41_13]|uniref:NGG1p interacting factor NIF3 n=1 Tax=Candidatus Komeilibacteria bacterium CG10_big_fil_rev_8_21_14_0_10_41_13 TaxID=1974476 RepID=A0A2M6WBS8_9BACT|nr:MAG: NGG1p interacting factor NIF3 [Candidatus Komeilibacteria bacterium CG10_big_fil_rev_8_21_14_0_10_41_13]